MNDNNKPRQTGTRCHALASANCCAASVGVWRRLEDQRRFMNRWFGLYYHNMAIKITSEVIYRVVQKTDTLFCTAFLCLNSIKY